MKKSSFVFYGYLLESPGDEGVEEPESGRGVFVQDGRVDVLVVIVHESLGVVKDLVLERVLQADEDREPFVVGDVLVLADVDLPGFLEDRFVVPVGVELGEGVGESVVLSEEDDLEDGQLAVLIDADVAGEVARFVVGLDRAGACFVNRCWRPFSPSANLRAEFSALESPNLGVHHVVVAVDDRKVQEVVDSCQLRNIDS